jgi:hypothetical protein
MMNQREQTDRTKFLDETIPLEGASHADVVSYGVDIPMRYAECVATLGNGTKARLRDARQFMGFSGRDHNRSLLFKAAGRRIVIDARGEQRQAEWNGVHKFTGRDGGLLFIRRWSEQLASEAVTRMQTFSMPVAAAV